MNETTIRPAASRLRLTRYIGEVCDEMGLDAEFRNFYFDTCDRCLIDLEKLERATRGEIEISDRHLANQKRDYINDCITIANLPGVKLGIYDVMDLAREVSHIERELTVHCVRDIQPEQVALETDDCEGCKAWTCEGCSTYEDRSTYEDDCNA